jgi:hypothetical protein
VRGPGKVGGIGGERLVRYLLRPPLAQDRLTRLADGRVVCTLGRPWHDGTRHLIFTPHEFLERLAAITPRPRINLVIYHGVLAPRSRWRPPGSDDPAVIAPPVPPPATSGPAATPSAVRPAPSQSSSPPTPNRPPAAWAWADLMRRVFAIDVLTCAGCGGRLRLLATIEDPATITKFLLDHDARLRSTSHLSRGSLRG